MAPRLYHISENPNLTVMTQRIPSNKLVKAGYENGTIGPDALQYYINTCLTDFDIFNQ